MKKTLKIVLATIILSVCGAMSMAADPMDYKNAIGMYYMNNTGACGLQYQNWITHRIGFQVEGYAGYNQNHYYTPAEYQFSIASQLLFNIYENPLSEKTGVNFYGWLLGEYKGYNDLKYVYPSNENTQGYYDPSGYLQQFSLGAGFGFEFMFWKHLSIPLEFGYAGTISKDPWMGFVIGSGLRFRF